MSSIKNPRALLYKTSYNIAIDLKRHGSVRQKHIDSVVDLESTAVEELGPERVVEGNRQLEILAKALWAMPKKRRKLVLMNRFDGHQNGSLTLIFCVSLALPIMLLREFPIADYLQPLVQDPVPLLPLIPNLQQNQYAFAGPNRAF